MQYELECGHCGYQFVLDVTALPRTTKCTVCGGVLTLAVPVPIASPARKAPAPPPPAPAKPPPPPPLPAPAGADPSDDRARRLVEPWRSVHYGLWLARVATIVAVPVCVPLLCVGSFLTPFVPPAQRGPVENVLWVLLAAHFGPAALHLAGQLRCLDSALKLPNARLVVASCVLSIASCLSPIGLTMTNSPAVAVSAFVVMNLAAFGAWTVFLARLGTRLGDDDLTFAVRAFVLWFAFGTVQAVTLLAGAYLAAGAERPVTAGCFRFAASAIGFFLLYKYSAVLRTAMRAVARRAPVAPHLPA